MQPSILPGFLLAGDLSEQPRDFQTPRLDGPGYLRNNIPCGLHRNPEDNRGGPSYEDSYAKAFSFDKMVDGMLNSRMIEDTVQLIREAFRRERRIAIIINNRAEATAP